MNNLLIHYQMTFNLFKLKFLNIYSIYIKDKAVLQIDNRHQSHLFRGQPIHNHQNQSRYFFTIQSR